MNCDKSKEKLLHLYWSIAFAEGTYDIWYQIDTNNFHHLFIDKKFDRGKHLIAHFIVI